MVAPPTSISTHAPDPPNAPHEGDWTPPFAKHNGDTSLRCFHDASKLLPFLMA